VKNTLCLPVLTVMMTAALAGCMKESGPSILQSEEATLVRELGFDESVALQFRLSGSGPLARLTGTNEEFQTYEAGGLTVPIGEKKALKTLFRLRETMGSAGYMIFIVERNFGYVPDRLALIKGSDQFEILRIQGTNGINYDIGNDEVITRLKEWNAIYPLDIIGAGLDFVEAAFVKAPEDMEAFAGKVYEFCPDVVDQGTGTVKALAAQMRRSGALYLWWD
jgi:hypothetical protein